MRRPCSAVTIAAQKMSEAPKPLISFKIDGCRSSYKSVDKVPRHLRPSARYRMTHEDFGFGYRRHRAVEETASGDKDSNLPIKVSRFLEEVG